MIDRTKENYEEYYEKIELIDYGTYGCVYKGREKATNELRAIKVMSIEKIEENLLYQYEASEIEKQKNLFINGFIEEFNTVFRVISLASLLSSHLKKKGRG